jgi:hypothetical protein
MFSVPSEYGRFMRRAWARRAEMSVQLPSLAASLEHGSSQAVSQYDVACYQLSSK